MKTGLLYGIVPNSKTRVRCVFCGVFIPKANKCIEQHANGAKHKENIDLMTDNGIAFVNERLYCKPCRLELTEDESVMKHIEIDGHATWVAAMEDLISGEFISLEPYLTSNKEDVYCEVCQSTVHCTLLNMEAHVNSLNHRTNVTERLKPLNGIFPVDNNDEVWCKVCNAFIENTARGILDHIDDDDEHMEWFTEIEDLIEEQEVSIESFLANEYENNAYCNRCHVEFTCNSQCIEAHVNSDDHLSQTSN